MKKGLKRATLFVRRTEANILFQPRAVPTVGEKRRSLAWEFRAPIGRLFRNGRIPPLSALGTHPANSRSWSTDGPKAKTGRMKMTLSYTSLQQLALAIVGAVLTSSLFVSAAVGPVPII